MASPDHYPKRAWRGPTVTGAIAKDRLVLGGRTATLWVAERGKRATLVCAAR